MVRPPHGSRGISFRDQLSELIADHSADVDAEEVSQSLQEISRALDESDQPPRLSRPASSFERKLNDLVQRHADLADDWARLTRTLSDLADDLELTGSGHTTLSTDTTYRRTDDCHLLTVVYPAPFLMKRAVDTLAEVGGLVVDGRVSIPILSSVDLRITCDGVEEVVELEARVVQQDDDALSLDVDVADESDAIDQLQRIARRETPDSRQTHNDSATIGSDVQSTGSTSRDFHQDRSSPDASSSPLPPGSRKPETPGETSNPFDVTEQSTPTRQPPGGHSPGAAVLRPAGDAPEQRPDEPGVGDRDRHTRRGRRLLDALNSLYTRTQSESLFAVLGLDWHANGINVRDAWKQTNRLIEQISALPLTDEETERLDAIRNRVNRAAKILRHSGSRREYRASQIDTERFVSYMEQLETRLAARVLRDDDAGARRVCAQLLELDPTHPNARYHKERLD